jgi:magnesium transporter
MEEDGREEELHSATGNLMESKTSRLDDLLNDKLEEALEKPTLEEQLHDLAQIGSAYSAVDLAHAVARLPAASRSTVFQHLPGLDDKLTFLINTDKATRVAIFRHLSDGEMHAILQAIAPDEGVWFLEDMSDRQYRRVMALLDPKKAQELQNLERLDRNSAGRLLTQEFFAFQMNTTIGEAVKYIRDHPGVELTRRIFVVSDQEELLGYVPARHLLVNPHSVPLRQVMRPVIHKVTPDASRDEVVDLVERYKIPALPVVDGENHLLGVITYEDIVEVMEDIADETIAMMAGTVEDVSEAAPVWSRFVARAPWLIMTAFGGVVSAAIMSFFQGVEEQVLALAIFFVPLVLGMSGNVGIQCSTVLVRSMATGGLSAGSKMQAVGRELVLGLLTGVVFGTLCGAAIYALDALHVQHFGGNPVQVGTLVALGILGASLLSSLLGVTSPLLFARLGVDPAVASGPLVTACNDILSMTMFFLIAQGLSRLIF